MSAAVGGVIGAMVTLGVILGIEALLLLVAGLRVVKNGTGGAGVELGNLTGRKQ
jgi:regulator of protease activity HflC (stomatin/prohibitin superfamily)